MKIRKLFIILGCCIITLFSLVFVGCKRNTAKANVISGDYLLELPMLTTTLDGSNIVIPNMYIGEDTNGMYIYYVATASGTSDLPYYIKSYFNEQIGLNYAFNYLDVSNYNNTYFNWLTNVSNGFSSIFHTFTQNSPINYLVNNAVKLIITGSYGELTYDFYDINDSQIGFLTINNIKNIGPINETYYSFNVLLGSFNETDVQIIYNDGYQEGFLSGYNVGVQDGFGATTPFDVFTDTINRFLDIEFFGAFKISTLLSIGFGLILLGIVIKVFLGG